MLRAGKHERRKKSAEILGFQRISTGCCIFFPGTELRNVHPHTGRELRGVCVVRWIRKRIFLPHPCHFNSTCLGCEPVWTQTAQQPRADTRKAKKSRQRRTRQTLDGIFERAVRSFSDAPCCVVRFFADGREADHPAPMTKGCDCIVQPFAKPNKPLSAPACGESGRVVSLGRGGVPPGQG